MRTVRLGFHRLGRSFHESSLSPSNLVSFQDVASSLIVDIVTGNSDRHPGNIFLGSRAGECLKIIPFDHDLAFSTAFIVGKPHYVDFLETISGNPKIEELCRKGTAFEIAWANSLYREMWKEIHLSKRSRQIFLDILTEFRSKIKRGLIERLIGETPGELFSPERSLTFLRQFCLKKSDVNLIL